MKRPDKISLAHLPTPVEKIEGLSKRFSKNIYIKRDDQTGTEVSGNKVRKLEYAVREALDLGCDTLMTCGGLQSNHARATAAVAAKLGLKCRLVLRDQGENRLEGNCLMMQLFGADITFLPPEAYEAKDQLMAEMARQIELEGSKAYIMPTGASNGIGSFGYLEAYEEIKRSDVDFDAIVVTVGSGGTFAGLFYGNCLSQEPMSLYGINISGNADYFQRTIDHILHELVEHSQEPINYCRDDIKILDGHAGAGYAISQPEELSFIGDFAAKEGILLDPVYTGKAMFGFYKELMKGTFDAYDNILFIHTGGMYGVFPKAKAFLESEVCNGK